MIFFVKLPNFERNLSLSLTSVRNKRMRNFASYAMPLIWNSLPLQTKRITSINALKKNYTATLMSNYATECNIANCFSCNNWILSIWTWPFDICFCSLCINHVCSLLCLTQPPPHTPAFIWFLWGLFVEFHKFHSETGTRNTQNSKSFAILFLVAIFVNISM